MKKIYIVGAGDFGRELESWIEQSINYGEDFSIAGYLDPNPNALENKLSSYHILGTIENFSFNENDFVLIAISDIATRMRIVEFLKGRVKFFTFIDDRVVIGKNTKICEGAIICPNSLISNNSYIGAFTIINTGSTIGHDCLIGEFCSLMANVDIGGRASIDKEVYLGTKSTILPGLSVKSNIIVGASSLVIKSLTKKGTYFGVPTKFLGEFK